MRHSKQNYVPAARNTFHKSPSWHKIGNLECVCVSVCFILFPYLKAVVKFTVAGDARACTPMSVSKKAQSVCVVFVRCCPPTGYLHREHDIKRDR